MTSEGNSTLLPANVDQRPPLTDDRPRISMFPLAPPLETLRFSGNKINCFPWDQSLSVYYSTGEQAEVHRVPPNDQPIASSSSHSCVPEVENERSQCDNVTVTAPEKEERGLHTDSSQQSETPVRPTTPEAAHGSSSMLSVVTGHRSSLQNNPMAEACLPGKEEENCDQVRNAAEHYDATENNGLVTELQKVIYYLHCLVNDSC